MTGARAARLAHDPEMPGACVHPGACGAVELPRGRARDALRERVHLLGAAVDSSVERYRRWAPAGHGRWRERDAPELATSRRRGSARCRAGQAVEAARGEA